MIALIPLDPASAPSVSQALTRLGIEHQWALRPEEARAAQLLLLASGAPFETNHAWLKEHGWWRELPHLIGDGRYLLALDSAVHLLVEGSEEAPRDTGLGLVPGFARRLGPGVKVPHLGWARTSQQRSHPQFPDPKEAWIYYAHTHALDPTEATWWCATHGRPFSALVSRGRVAGFQGRLDRSGAHGVIIFQALLAWAGQVPVRTSTPELN